MNFEEALQTKRIIRHKNWKNQICLKHDDFHKTVNILASKWIIGVEDEEAAYFYIDYLQYIIIGYIKHISTEEDLKNIISIIAEQDKKILLLQTFFEFLPVNFNDDNWEIVE